MQPVQRPARSRTATDRLATLPQELLHLIISYADRLSRLAMFRTCKPLRDAVLSHQPTEILDEQQEQQGQEHQHLLQQGQLQDQGQQLQGQGQEAGQQLGQGQGQGLQEGPGQGKRRLRLHTILFLVAGEGSKNVGQGRKHGVLCDLPGPEEPASPLAGCEQAASHMHQGSKPQQSAEEGSAAQGKNEQQSIEPGTAAQGSQKQQSAEPCIAEQQERLSVEHSHAQQGNRTQQKAEHSGAAQGNTEQEGCLPAKRTRGLIRGMTAANSSRLLHLASTSSHDVHLHIFAAWQTAIPFPEPDCLSSSLTNKLALVIEYYGMTLPVCEQLQLQQLEEVQPRQQQPVPQQEQEQHQGVHLQHDAQLQQQQGLLQEQGQQQQQQQQVLLQEQVPQQEQQLLLQEQAHQEQQQQEQQQPPLQEQVHEQQQQQLLSQEQEQQQGLQQEMQVQQQLLLQEQVQEQHQGMQQQQQLYQVQQLELDVDLLYKHMIEQQQQEWLSALFKPWVTTSSTSLNHITALWFHDLWLASPFPDCVGLACPCLVQLELADVKHQC